MLTVTTTRLDFVRIEAFWRSIFEGIRSYQNMGSFEDVYDDAAVVKQITFACITILYDRAPVMRVDESLLHDSPQQIFYFLCCIPAVRATIVLQNVARLTDDN